MGHTSNQTKETRNHSKTKNYCSPSQRLYESATSTKNGIAAFDDTGCLKPYAKKTQGAQWQYCAPLKREETCNVAVASAFVSQTKHFPFDIISYIPADEFKEGETGIEKLHFLVY